MDRPGIELKNVSVSYTQGNKQNLALKDVSLSIGKGSVTAIIGASGCGKSTLLKVMAGLEDYQGEVLIAGKRQNPKQQKIGFMPQNYGLLPWRTVEENILLAAKLKGELTKAKENLPFLLKILGITELKNRYPGEISGGEGQRAALARVFLLAPDVLLMDEPFSALDVITRERIQEVFLSLWQRQKLTTILVTHFVEEALYLGQNIVLMSKVKGYGAIEAIMENPYFGQKAKSTEIFCMGQKLRERLAEMQGGRA